MQSVRLACLYVSALVLIKSGILSADKDMQLGRIFEDKCAEMYYRVRIASYHTLDIPSCSVSCERTLVDDMCCVGGVKLNFCACTGKDVWFCTSLLWTGGRLFP